MDLFLLVKPKGLFEWCVIFSVGESSTSFSWHMVCLRHLSDERCCALSSTFLSSSPFKWVFPLSTSRIVPSILEGQIFFLQSYITINFPGRLRYSFYISILFFLSSSLVWWCPLPILPYTCNFPFPQAFWFFLDLTVLLLLFLVFFYFSLLAWNISVCQILFLYPDSIYLSFLWE